MQSALRLKPTFTDAYNNLASALVQKGMVPAALQCYQAALQINPQLVSVAAPADWLSCAWTVLDHGQCFKVIASHSRGRQSLLPQGLTCSEFEASTVISKPLFLFVDIHVCLELTSRICMACPHAMTCLRTMRRSCMP